MASADVEEVPMQPKDEQHADKAKKPFIVFTKELFIITVIVILLLVVIVGVLSGVISAKYAEERTRRELLDDKSKRVVVPSTVGPSTEPLGPEPWYRVRLPANVRPIHYDLYLHPNLTTETFEGNVRVLVNVTEPTEYILIHINEMTITESWVYTTKRQGDQDVQTGEVDVKERNEYKKNNFYYFVLSSSLEPGRYIISMSFKAKLSVALNGLYLSTYEDKARGTRKLATSDFEPTDARKALPCFDEPAMKATFTTTIIHEPDYTALSNMPEEQNETLPNGLIQTRFQKSVPMSTYLLAFIVCDFEYKQNVTGKHGNVTLRVWTTRDQINQTDYALYVASEIITYFEEYYKVDYPLPKQDLIAIPDFSSGAMENWGLITFRETRLLFQDGVSSERNKQNTAAVISHELAHQWFGNIVSPKWWNDLWLNEGFASYVEYLGVAHIYKGKWEMMDQFLLSDLQLVFPLDSLTNSHPISVTVDHPKQIKQIFDRISYSKGASIIRMLNGFLGDDDFTSGLQSYLKKYAFKNAETKNLWNALGTQSNTDVEKVMDTWTLQMGFPVVKVTRNGNKATVTQKHFLLDPNGNVTVKSRFGYKWYVPFTYVTQDTPKNLSLTWMNMTSADIKVPGVGKWIKGNYQQIGYYRVHYDDDNWVLLSKQLEDDFSVFSGQDRSGLIDDAFSLARAGYVGYPNALRMLKYLSKETNYVTWRTALNRLSYLKTVLGNRPSFGNLKKFIRKKVKPLAERLGWVTKNDDGHIDKYLRSSLLGSACSNGDPDANRNVTDIFNEWKADQSRSIDVDLRSLVYRYGVANSGVEEWKWMFKKFVNESDASEKSKLMASLGSNNQPWVLNRFLASSLDTSLIRTQDMVSAILAVAYNPVGKYLAWNFVRANWGILLERLGTSTFRMSSLVNGVTHAFNTEFDLEQMQTFFKDTEAGTSGSARTQSIERTRLNIDWLKRNEAEVQAWLESNA